MEFLGDRLALCIRLYVLLAVSLKHFTTLEGLKKPKTLIIKRNIFSRNQKVSNKINFNLTLVFESIFCSTYTQYLVLPTLVWSYTYTILSSHIERLQCCCSVWNIECLLLSWNIRPQWGRQIWKEYPVVVVVVVVSSQSIGNLRADILWQNERTNERTGRPQHVPEKQWRENPI